MYVHIGKDVVINANNIIGIFNLEFIESTDEYKKIYENMLDANCIKDISDNYKKSFILYNENQKVKAFISNISANTIAKRKNFVY